MEVWLKVLHLAFMALWVGVLFYLPRMLLSHSAQRAQRPGYSDNEGVMIRREEFLFFYLGTGAAVLTILFGIGLTVYGIEGGWLPVKLVLVSLLALAHFYCGQVILAFRGGEVRHGRVFFHAMTHGVALLLLGVLYLALAKPF